MLNPQVIMNLLPELRIGVNLTVGSRWAGKRFMADAGLFFPLALSVSAFPSETNEFHNDLSVFSCLLQIGVERGIIVMGCFEEQPHSRCLKAPDESGDRATRCLSEG